MAGSDRRERLGVLDRLDQRHRPGGYLTEGADHLGMAGMADEDDVAPRRDQSLRLAMDLRYQRTGRVEIVEAAVLRGGGHRFGHAMRREDHGRAVGHLVQLLDEHRALRAQAVDDEAVVDDLVPDINRRAVLLDREFDNADGTVDAGAKAARRGDQQVRERAWTRAGRPTRLLARAEGGSYGAALLKECRR